MASCVSLYYTDKQYLKSVLSFFHDNERLVFQQGIRVSCTGPHALTETGLPEIVHCAMVSALSRLHSCCHNTPADMQHTQLLERRRLTEH